MSIVAGGTPTPRFLSRTVTFVVRGLPITTEGAALKGRGIRADSVRCACVEAIMSTLCGPVRTGGQGALIRGRASRGVLRRSFGVPNLSVYAVCSSDYFGPGALDITGLEPRNPFALGLGLHWI